MRSHSRLRAKVTSVTAILGFATLDPEKAEMVENEMKMKETPVMESEIAYQPG